MAIALDRPLFLKQVIRIRRLLQSGLEHVAGEQGRLRRSAVTFFDCAISLGLKRRPLRA